MSSEFRLDRYPVAFLRPRLRQPYSWAGHIPFAYALIDMLRPATYVELGTDTGNSYLAICQAVKHLRLATRCFAVDSWIGDPHARFYGEDVYRTLRAYHDPKYGSFSTLVRKYFEDAVSDFDDNSIDLLHIDGLHTYEAVRNDFETWKPKLSERAVVLFHDSTVKDGDFGVWKFIEELAETYSMFSFNHSNGLTVMQVGARPAPEVSGFLALCRREPAQVRCYFEAIAATLVDPETQIPMTGVDNNEEGINCVLYYRMHGEIFEQSRSMSQHLCVSAVGDSTECRFKLGKNHRPDVIRIDPAERGGVFSLNRVVLESVAGRVLHMEPGATRLLAVNGEIIEPPTGSGWRIAAFNEDPWFELDMSGCWSLFPEGEDIDILLSISYEVVLLDNSVRYVARKQEAASEIIRKQGRTDGELNNLRMTISSIESGISRRMEELEIRLVSRIEEVERRVSEKIALADEHLGTVAANANEIKEGLKMVGQVQEEILAEEQRRIGRKIRRFFLRRPENQ